MIFSGAVVLCAFAALLLDAKMYLSAGLIGVLGALALVTFPLQYFRVRRENKERAERNLVREAHRSEAAQAVGKRFIRPRLPSPMLLGQPLVRRRMLPIKRRVGFQEAQRQHFAAARNATSSAVSAAI